ncbi:WYL domain-containing protein [Brevibacillus nitrificans]|uniref:WYL domain-containing protein n=1 Tax=Brevibacillus nitrificans TaxID=651560 RepID=A0A3M8D392_9BACL|nr:WYL domain-containing protein [Brevibacillus nitrificans]RNB82536.1 WYL domain-containing protein [Brevibacillus nitrificans]
MNVDQEYSVQKVARMLRLFERLLEGTPLQKGAVAQEFGVSAKTVQRDIEDLRDYFAEYRQGASFLLAYDRAQRGYILQREASEWLAADEIMGITKILLESRAFPKDELDRLLEKLSILCRPEDRKHIKEAVNNERFLYRPVNHNRPLFQTLWELTFAVRERRLVDLQYRKIGVMDEINRRVEPLGIMFSEYYFYLIAHLHNGGKEYPAVYRLDRIRDYVVTNEHFRVEETKRFQAGEFRQKVQFMQMGKLMKVEFKYWGASIEAVADRLPNASIVEQDGSYVVKAEVFGRGIKMWLLSQAQYVEVVKPEEFRQEMMQTIEQMRDIYGKK